MRHVREWNLPDDGSEDVSEALGRLMAEVKDGLQFSPTGIYRLDHTVKVKDDDPLDPNR